MRTSLEKKLDELTDAIRNFDAQESGFVRLRDKNIIAQERDLFLENNDLKTEDSEVIFIAYKDMFFRQGELCECGSQVLKNYRPGETAVALKRLDKAGVVSVGALHMAEFAMSPTGFNEHFGSGRNPLNRDYISGGSSSGSAIAVANNYVDGSLGSDTGGSIRLPAAACGVIGLKVTNYLIPFDGAMPLAPSLDCLGIIGKSFTVCRELLDKLLQGQKHSSGEMANASALESEIYKITLPILDNSIYVSDEIKTALGKLENRIKDRDIRIRKIDEPNLLGLNELANIILGSEAASYHRTLLEKNEALYGRQVLNRIIKGFEISSVDYIDAKRLRKSLQREFVEKYIEKNGTLILPVFPDRIPLITEVDESTNSRAIGDISYWTRAINYLGLPAISIPVGNDSRGLPIGLQLIGRPGTDRELIDIASRLVES